MECTSLSLDYTVIARLRSCLKKRKGFLVKHHTLPSAGFDYSNGALKLRSFKFCMQVEVFSTFVELCCV